METQLTVDYGIETPIVSAGMAFVARAALAAAVSEAGGLGVVGATAMPPELVQAEIDAIRARTGKPFGMNFIPRFGAEEQVGVCAAQKVPVVVFYWDPPEAGWVDLLHDAGTKVWFQVGSPAEAEAAVAAGADLVIVQGSEGGGHNRAMASTFSLVPVIADAIDPVPVLAAGGIADGRGVAAALALGAAGAWVGTRFLASEEADAHPGYKERVVSAGVTDTVRHWTFGYDFPEASVRGIRNEIVAEHEGNDQPPPYAATAPEDQPQIGTADLFGQATPMVKYMGFPPTSGATGDLEQMSLLAGESVGLTADVQGAGDIVRALTAEARDVLSRLTP